MKFQISLTRTSQIALAAICLIVGGCIYIFFRQANLLMFGVFGQTLPDWLMKSRLILSSIFMADWVLYSLPDGLWALAYMLTIDSIWHNCKKSFVTILLIYLMPFMALGFEVFQMLDLTNGTGDWMDIAFYIISILLFITLKHISV